MEKDNVFIGEEARARLMKGVDKVADAVKGTLGAGGYNALLADPRPPYAIPTNDGISVARAIYLGDPIEQMGANLMREIGAKSDKEGGDGTTTSITLAQAILQEGLGATESPMEVKRSLEECLPIILKSLDEQKRDITVDEVGKVASIAAEDERIGALIQEIYQKIGKDGILYPDISRTPDDHYTVGSGVKIEGAGLSSPYMSDEKAEGGFTRTVNISTPKILITKQEIPNLFALERAINLLIPQGIKDLVVFCDQAKGVAISEAILTRQKNGFRTIIVQLPVLWQNEWFEDVAKMTGATVIDPSIGVGLDKVQSAYLGSCETLVIDRYDTFFEGILDLSTHIKELEAGSDEDKIRAARLNTKTARLFVGAHSESALAYKRLKVEDARNAAWQALHGGVCVGGGIALYNASKEMPDTVGGNILRSALQAPLKQIMVNAGDTSTEIILPSANHGFNAKTGKVEDMFEAGIVDACPVVKNAITNAISVAATVLTTRVIVSQPDISLVGGPPQSV